MNNILITGIKSAAVVYIENIYRFSNYLMNKFAMPGSVCSLTGHIDINDIGYVFFLQYLIAHLRRVVRNEAGVTIEGTAPPTGQDSKQTLYAKYCLRHIASPRTQTRKFAPSNAEIEVLISHIKYEIQSHA